MSYKSDAIDLLAKVIETETKETIPAGEELEISEEAIEEIQSQINDGSGESAEESAEVGEE